MAVNLNEVSKETRTMLADVRSIGRRVMEGFYEGFAAALRDIHRTWKHLRPQERKLVFDKAQQVAKDIIVDKKDGGGADNGLALRTFYHYVCKVKRALIYSVPLDIAERATNTELQEAFAYIREQLGETADRPCNADSAKMVAGYQYVRAEHVRRREAFRQQAAEMVKQQEAGKNGTGRTTATLETPYTLPDPAGYQTTDEDSDALLRSGIQSFLAWLHAKGLQPHLEKRLQSAMALKAAGGVLTVYDIQHERAAATVA